MSFPVSQMIQLPHRGEKVDAYLSRPPGPGKHPAVIVIHEWWGLVEHIKDVANRYASQGYVALAPDLYRQRTTTSREEAGKFSASVTTDASSALLSDALAYLKGADFVRSDRIGITGFCFGGTHSFHFTCVSREIRAAAVYYATRLPSEDLLARITAPLLIIYGDLDASVKPEEAKRLDATLKRLGKESELLMYGGCPHAFFNDQNPQVYRPAAAKDAWSKTLHFFQRNLKA